MTLCPDRNGDITRLLCNGTNLSYFSPCGYVAPAYYDKTGNNWLQSFTAGFLTTCGLQAVGSPCVDEGEELPLHGSIANQPAERSYWEEDDAGIRIHTLTRDEVIFGRKLTLKRVIEVSKEENSFTISDEIQNTGDRREPVEILYHMNMGYPLLDEESVVSIPSAEVVARDDHAAEDIAHWMHMEKPDYFRCEGTGRLCGVEDDGHPGLCAGTGMRQLLPGRAGRDAQDGDAEIPGAGGEEAVQGACGGAVVAVPN